MHDFCVIKCQLHFELWFPIPGPEPGSCQFSQYIPWHLWTSRLYLSTSSPRCAQQYWRTKINFKPDFQKACYWNCYLCHAQLWQRSSLSGSQLMNSGITAPVLLRVLREKDKLRDCEHTNTTCALFYDCCLIEEALWSIFLSLIIFKVRNWYTHFYLSHHKQWLFCVYRDNKQKFSADICFPFEI